MDLVPRKDEPHRKLRWTLRIGLPVALTAAYFLWNPGSDVRDGRHDRGRNGIWLQHGWLGDDGWFRRTPRRRQTEFRDPSRIKALADLLRRHHITDVFPHLCPAGTDGAIPPVDDGQATRFLDAFQGFRVVPWVGGVLGQSARPADPAWRAAFVGSIRALLSRHPRFAGIQVNVEPCPSGDAAYLTLLDELRAALGPERILSVAAYPPPTLWHRAPAVHWEEAYFREVAARADQMAVMMYDTALGWPRVYRSLMADWTREVLTWSGRAEVLLGLPAYDDEGVDWHDPATENLLHGLAGIHAGLAALGTPPARYQGVALYSEWEMDEAEWALLRERFLRAGS